MCEREGERREAEFPYPILRLRGCRSKLGLWVEDDKEARKGENPTLEVKGRL